MGNGIPYFMSCCENKCKNSKDIEINRISSKINSMKDFIPLFYYLYII